MKKVFIHRPLFRLFVPLFSGFLAYILILLVFDSINQLRSNYINQEVFFCIGLSYLVFESLRFSILKLEKWKPLKNGDIWRVCWQLLTGVIVTSIVVSLSIAGYFTLALNYSDFSTELIIFNAIFILCSLLYSLLHASLSMLMTQNESKLQEEELKKENLRLQLTTLNNEIKPDFLYQSLETLITLLYHDEEQTDHYIDNLSHIYRYYLSHKNTELVEVEKELAIVEILLEVLNERHDHLLSIENSSRTLSLEKKLIPGSLNLVVENLVDSNIVSKIRPLVIKFQIEDDYFVIAIKENVKLAPRDMIYIKELQGAYDHFSIKPIISIKAYGEHFIKLPLLEVYEPEQLSL